MIWTLLVTGALAAEGDAVLADRLMAVRDGARETVLVAAAGPDAERAVERALKPTGGDGFVVARIPTAGDLSREAQGALLDAGLRCGVQVGLGADGVWAIAPFGDCQPPAGAMGGAGNRAGERPLQVASQRTEDHWAQLEQRYNPRRLQTEDVRVGADVPAGVDWRVVDGRGVAVSTRQLADLAGDDELMFQLDQEQRAAYSRSRWTSRATMSSRETAPPVRPHSPSTTATVQDWIVPSPRWFCALKPFDTHGRIHRHCRRSGKRRPLRTRGCLGSSPALQLNTVILTSCASLESQVPPCDVSHSKPNTSVRPRRILCPPCNITETAMR